MPNSPRFHTNPILAAMSSIVLVTGAAKGLGLEIVRTLAKHHPPVVTYLGARDPRKGSAAASSIGNPNVKFLPIDLDDDSILKASAKQLTRDHGRLDVLVNNAEILIPSSSPIPPSEQACRTIGVNYLGTRRVTETFLPLLSSAAAPRVINITHKGDLVNSIIDQTLRQRLSSDALTLEQLDTLTEEYLAAVADGSSKAKGWGDVYSTSKALMSAYTAVLARTAPGIAVAGLRVASARKPEEKGPTTTYA